MGWVVGRVTGRKTTTTTAELAWIAGREDGTCVLAPSFSRHTTYIVFLSRFSPRANARDRHDATRPSLHLAQSAAVGPDRCRPRTRVGGGVPCRARGNVVVMVVARCSA